MSTNQNPKMEKDFFTNLPPEIIIDILSRLPIGTIMSCKSVHKAWLNLVKTLEFAKSHLSISVSVPGLIVFEDETSSEPYTVFEIADELGHENSGNYFNVVFNFSFLHDEQIRSSVNGFLFLWDRNLSICNPITRDYIKLPRPSECLSLLDTFGFGVSKITGQYKDLGEGAGSPLKYDSDEAGAFLNGNLHWLASDSEDHRQISCFDLETEQFSTFSLPPDHPDVLYFCCLHAFGDCLCLCNTNTSDDEIVIWLMKEYGDEESWTEEIIIRIQPHSEFHAYFPVKVFKDGHILIVGVEEQNT